MTASHHRITATVTATIQYYKLKCKPNIITSLHSDTDTAIIILDLGSEQFKKGKTPLPLLQPPLTVISSNDRNNRNLSLIERKNNKKNKIKIK